MQFMETGMCVYMKSTSTMIMLSKECELPHLNSLCFLSIFSRYLHFGASNAPPKQGHNIGTELQEHYQRQNTGKGQLSPKGK